MNTEEKERALALAEKPVQVDDGCKYVVPASDLVQYANTLRELMAEVEKNDAQMEAIGRALKATFGSQYEDEYQLGKIAMAEWVADILGWEK